MRISIAVIAADVAVSNEFIALEVFPDMSLDDVKGFVEAEIAVASSAQRYIINDQIVTQTSRSLTDIGVKDGDILSLAIQTRPPPTTRPAQGQTSQARPTQRRGNEESEMYRLQILGNPDLLQSIRRTHPELANEINNPSRFAQLWQERARQAEEAQKQRERMIAELEADPFNPEAQQKIEEMIRQERVIENGQKALEENPESFVRVTMLYIDVVVNDVPIKAFVDSGAQTTIMSPDAAERCGIMRLIDRNYAGIARGVGTAKILGRVHTADIRIGPYILASSFTVMEGKDVDLLLGLDMLKRHQMCIDLKENCLRVGDDKVPFLPEGEIPKMMEEINEKEPKVEGPGGTKIGAETGTLLPPTPGPNEQSTQPGSSSGSRINIHPMGSAGNVNTNRSAPQAGSSRPTQSQVQGQNQGQEQPIKPFGAPAPITEQSIALITDLGFSREEAVVALQQVGGNVDLAIGLLL